jgi:hypothetical protein
MHICCSATVSREWHSVFKMHIYCSATVSREWHSALTMHLCCSATVSRELHTVLTMHICCSATASREWLSIFKMNIYRSATVSQRLQDAYIYILQRYSVMGAAHRLQDALLCSATVSREWHSIFKMHIYCSATVSREWHSFLTMHCSATVTREWHSLLTVYIFCRKSSKSRILTTFLHFQRIFFLDLLACYRNGKLCPGNGLDTISMYQGLFKRLKIVSKLSSYFEISKGFPPLFI